MRMRWIVPIGVVFVGVLYFVLMQPAKEEAPKPTVASQAVISASEEVLPSQEEQERRREQLREELRVQDLAEAKEAIARFRGRKDDDWVAVVKGGLSGSLAELCGQVETLVSFPWVFERLDVQSADRFPIGWTDLGVSRAELWKEFVAASKKAATALFAVYRRSPAERSFGCGRGEGSWRFDEPGEVMQRLLWVMENAKVRPAQIGTTAELMHAALVNDYRVRIARYRKIIVRGEASRLGGYGIIFNAVREAEQIWGIPRSKLGLTAEEKQVLAAQR